MSMSDPKKSWFSFPAAAARLIVVCAFLVGFDCCFAQSSWVTSAFPMRTLEKYVGPIFPTGPWGSSFRSEIGTGLTAAEVKAAKLVGSTTGELDLERAASLDKGPLEVDVYANLRLWRFGARAEYSNFTTRSRHRNYGKIDFSGIKLGFDADAVQLNWLALGCSVDFYLMNPTFQGQVTTLDPFHNNALVNALTLEVNGSKPATIGPYLRYVPPEILGFPLHFDAFYYLPLKGSKLTKYGCSFTFRPQIYRFDLALRFTVQRTHLKFNSDPDVQFATTLTGPPFQQWELDLEWDKFGGDFIIYF
jgi:hypothetical protein